MRAGLLQAASPLNIARLIKARTQLNDRGDLFARIGCVDKRFDNRRITACTVQRDFNRQHLWITRRGLDPFDNMIDAVVRMMKEYIMVSKDVKKIDMRRKGRVASRMRLQVSKLRKRIVCHERHELRNRKRPIEFVSI